MKRKNVIITHGNMAEGILNSCSLFFDITDYKAFGLQPGEDVELFYDKVEKELLDENYENILVLTDIVGGTPYNTATKVFLKNRESKNIDIIFGVNLPMLLELGFNEEDDMEKLKEKAIDAGQEGIMDLKNKLKNLYS